MLALLNEIIAFSNIWATGIWSVIYQSSFLACIIFMITRYKKISASLRFGLWMLVILRMLVMPVATVSLPVLPSNEIVIPEQQTAKYNDQDRDNISGSGIQVETEDLKRTMNNEVAIDLRSGVYVTLFFMWIVGTILFLLRIIVGWFRINNIIKNGSPVDDQDITRTAQRAARSVGLNQLPSIIYTQENISSFVHGFFRPVVVLPQGIIEKLSKEQLLSIFTHEFTHLKRLDPFAGWIVTICQVFYFFHPCYYLARYFILLDREIACDDRVISLNRQCKSVYAQALINANDVCREFSYQFAPKAVAPESYSHLKKRLLHMADRLDNTGRMSIRAIVFITLIALISIPGISLTERSAALQTHHNEDRNTIIKDPLVIAYSNNIAGYVEPCS
jgi:beta-lactamase regulating signal transducer with metallopeptidase domain